MLHSTLWHETNLVFAYRKSSEARLVYARQEMKNITNIGNKGIR